MYNASMMNSKIAAVDSWAGYIAKYNGDGVQLGVDMRIVFMLLFGVFLSRSAIAQEFVSYKYDAKGRLVKVIRAGSVNNGVSATYTHDKANNRTSVKVAGAPQ